ncbi:MAG: CBS domain-containing protein [candidate division Zixibacteria bacterium]|nr:CBS domain-containing protein [candidate division Zixibacteria bacterium]
MNAAAILKRKGSLVVTVFPDASVREAMRVLIKHAVGSLIVLGEARDVVGIITERDIFRLSYEHEGKIMDIPVSAVMTTNLIVALPSDSLDYLKAMMTENRIRHLPVMNDRKLIGVISIGDIIREEVSEAAVENRYLKDYIAGVYPA